MTKQKNETYVSVVVPMFNEQESIPELYHEIKSTLERLGKPYEIVLVDDGSTDNTLAKALQLSKDDDHVTVIQLSRNFGHHPAATCGMAYSTGKIVVLLDADLQNDPADIPRLVEQIEAGFDVVRGWRKGRKDPLWRRVPSRFVNWLTCKATGVKLHDYGCSMVACRREIADRLASLTERSRHTSALISWLGGKVCELQVNHRPRRFGRSKYHFISLVRLTVNLITGFSTLPLQLVGLLGIITSGLGFAGAIYLVIKRYVYGVDLSGVVIVTAIFFVFIGIHFLALGVMGEYIGRIFTEVQGRPYYIVRRLFKKGSVAQAGPEAPGPGPNLPSS